MGRKLSDILDEQAEKTDAILRYVSKKPVDDPIVYMHLLYASNSLKVAQMAAAKLDDGKKRGNLDRQALLVQVRQFFDMIDESYIKKK